MKNRLILFALLLALLLTIFSGCAGGTQKGITGCEDFQSPDMRLGVATGSPAHLVSEIVYPYDDPRKIRSCRRKQFLRGIFKAGLEAVDDGRREAASALGLNPAETFRRITLPQAAEHRYPPDLPLFGKARHG